MNPMDEKQLFFDMQEHPERYSDEQLEAMMAELDKEPDTEAAWLLLNEELRIKNEESLAETTAVANFSLFTSPLCGDLHRSRLPRHHLVGQLQSLYHRKRHAEKPDGARHDGRQG